MTLALQLPPAGGSGAGEHPRVAALKQRVGYEAALATERAGEHVALDPRDVAPPAVLQGWALDRQVDVLRTGETELAMRFTRGAGVVSVNMSFFPPQERQRVADKLIGRANAVTHTDITDTRGPADLGTLSLTPGTNDTVYWIYRNVFAEVVVFQSDLDKLVVARAIQQQLQGAVRQR
jgi:hypothetical protein